MATATSAAAPAAAGSETIPGESHAAVPPAADCGVPREKRRAIVVGASSGIGAAIVRQLVHEGYRVAALARREDRLAELAEACEPLAEAGGGSVAVHVHDVHDTAAVPALFERIARELGGLHLLVYAAGIMPGVARDEYDTEKDLDQIAVNLSGCVAWCNAAARLFQTQREGTIVGVSSIAGDRGRRKNPVYCTTKAAMNTYLEALRNRLSECGARVCTVKPGFVDTVMTKGMEGLFWLISPEQAARLILEAARSGASTRYVPRRWWLVGTIVRSIPSIVFRHLEI